MTLLTSPAALLLLRTTLLLGLALARLRRADSGGPRRPRRRRPASADRPADQVCPAPVARPRPRCPAPGGSGPGSHSGSPRIGGWGAICSGSSEAGRDKPCPCGFGPPTPRCRTASCPCSVSYSPIIGGRGVPTLALGHRNRAAPALARRLPMATDPTAPPRCPPHPRPCL